MLRSLARTKFIDESWTANDLDLLAGFWLRLCRGAYRSDGIRFQVQQFTELRLTGFPRAAIAGVRAALAERGPDISVKSPDSDTLIVSWKTLGSDDAPPSGLGLPLLVASDFQGAIVEIRFAVASGRRVLKSTTSAGYTLVVVGELRDGALRVMSLWGGQAPASETAVYDNPTPWEYDLLAGFNRFRGVEKRHRSRDTDLQWALEHPLEDSAAMMSAKTTGKEQTNPWYIRALILMLDVPFGKPRLRGLLLRSCVLLGLLAAVLIAIVWHLVAAQHDLVLLALLALLLPMSILTFLFTYTELKMLRQYSEIRAAGDRWCRRQPIRYAPLPPEETRVALDDPAIRLATNELAAAGFRHAGDATSIPHDRATTLYRIFHAPDGITYLILICGVAWRNEDAEHGPIWPARIGFECQTFFEDGRRVDSVNFEDTQTTRVIQQPSRLLAFPKATEPLELFECHTAAVAALALESAGIPVRHESQDQYINRQNTINEEEIRAYAKHPYSWREHLRWYLQLDEKPPEKSE